MKHLGLLGINIETYDFNESIKWFKKHLNYSYTLFNYYGDNTNYDNKSTVIIGNNGGLALFLKQNFKNQKIRLNNVSINSLGVLALKIKTNSLYKIYLKYKSNNIKTFSKIIKSPWNKDLFWIKDPIGNNFIFEQYGDQPYLDDSIISSIYGVVIGVKNINSSIQFFTKLGYKVKVNKTTSLKDFAPIGANDFDEANRAILISKNNEHFLSSFIGETAIELVEVKSNNYTTSPLSLKFLINDAYKSYKNKYQFQVFDHENFSVLKANLTDPDSNLKHELLEIYKLKFRGVLTWNLKYSKLNAFSKTKVNFLKNNALEKI